MKYSVLLALFVLACQPTTVALQEGDPLPSMDFAVVGGPTPTLEVPEGYPLMVIYFDPFCEHCNEFAASLSGKADSWGELVYYWVSQEKEPAIQAFMEKYPVLKTGYHYFLRDSQYRFDELFGYSEVPTIFVFDEAHQFVQQY